MGHLTLRLPETLHQQLAQLAECEGVSPNQHIVYALTRQTASDYTVYTVPVAEVQQQQEAFKTILDRLGASSSDHLMSSLSKREEVEPEDEDGS